MRKQMWSALAASVLMAGAGAAHAAPVQGGEGRLALVLENCVPASPTPQQLERAIAKRVHHDLHVDLTVKGGKIEAAGGAWFAALPACEHKVSVVSGGELSPAGEFAITLKVDVLHQLPIYTGGTGEITIKGAISNNLVTGTYEAVWVGLDQKQQAALWREIGAPATLPPAFKGGLRSGKTVSITNLARNRVTDEPVDPIAVKGELLPLRTVAKEPLNVAMLKRALATPEGVAAVAKMKALMATETGVLQKRAGAALLTVTGHENGLDMAAADVTQPWDLLALALVADLLGTTFDPETRARLKDELLAGAEKYTQPEMGRWSGQELAQGKVWQPEGAWDYQLAQRRAAGGYAALLAKELGADASRAQRAIDVSARSVERFIKTGVGRRGAGNGNNGYDEALEAVLPFVQAYRRYGGEDLATGTGLAWVSLWAAHTRGLVVNPQAGAADTSSWLVVAGLPLAAPAHREGLMNYVASRGLDAGDALQAALAVLNWPEASNAKRTASLPRILADDTMNAYSLRSGWDDAKDFVTLFEMGSATERASAMRGHYSVYGLGREWILRTPAKRGEMNWPATRELNVLQILASETTTRGDVVNVGGSSMAQIRARRDGSATSISMRTGGFYGATGIEDESLIEDSKSWRTLGVDYSGASGAPALVAIVEGTFMLDDRHQVFELNVGPVPAEHVKINGLAFTLTAPGSKQTMTGHFLYPTTAFIEYVAPTKDVPNGRIRAHRQKPGEKSLQAMMKKLDERLDAKIDAMLKDQDSNIDVRQFDLKLEEANTAQQEQQQRQNEIVYLKMLKETSSVKMGSPDRRPRAKSSWVVILTIQDGAAPAVKVLDTSVDALCNVGGQTVTYRENLIEFAK